MGILSNNSVVKHTNTDASMLKHHFIPFIQNNKENIIWQLKKILVLTQNHRQTTGIRFFVRTWWLLLTEIEEAKRFFCVEKVQRQLPEESSCFTGEGISINPKQRQTSAQLNSHSLLYNLRLGSSFQYPRINHTGQTGPYGKWRPSSGPPLAHNHNHHISPLQRHHPHLKKRETLNFLKSDTLW